MQISRQRSRKRSFLLLELLVAIAILGLCALPLARIPLNTIQQGIESSYRVGMHRLGDLAFADIKEKVYKHEISWDELSHPFNKKYLVLSDQIDLSLKPLGSKKFLRRIFLYSTGKKDKQGIEWRKVTCRVEFTPKKAKSLLFRPKKAVDPNTCVFLYQFLITKLPSSASDDKTPSS